MLWHLIRQPHRFCIFYEISDEQHGINIIFSFPTTEMVMCWIQGTSYGLQQYSFLFCFRVKKMEKTYLVIGNGDRMRFSAKKNNAIFTII